MTARDVTQEAP